MKTTEQKTAHTPGPWRVSPGGSMITAMDRSPINPIAWTHDTEAPVEEKLANLALIAAAPDLLNMLQRMIDETGDSESKPCLLTLEHARAAIAKAKGGAR